MRVGSSNSVKAALGVAMWVKLGFNAGVKGAFMRYFS